MSKNYDQRVNQLILKWKNRHREIMNDLDHEERITIIQLLREQSKAIEEFLDDMDVLACMQQQEEFGRIAS
jgi:hypothetical protein